MAVAQATAIVVDVASTIQLSADTIYMADPVRPAR